jgi:hypothetical protein
MQPVGHASAQAPQAMHSSEILNAITVNLHLVLVLPIFYHKTEKNQEVFKKILWQRIKSSSLCHNKYFYVL